MLGTLTMRATTMVAVQKTIIAMGKELAQRMESVKEKLDQKKMLIINTMNHTRLEDAHGLAQIEIMKIGDTIAVAIENV